MATKAKSTKSTPAVLDEDIETVEETSAEPTLKQTINAGIARVAEELGVEAKDRYKVQRALGFIAMRSAIEDGTFDELLDATVADAADLPAGYSLERTVAAEKPKAKATSTKKTAAAKAPAKTARKRPTR